MRILVADDDPGILRFYQTLLPRWGYEVVACADGTEAARLLGAGDAPRIAIFDWTMPGRDGLELCRMVRRQESSEYLYVLIVTAARDRHEDMIEALEAGADDFLSKPLHPAELRVRLQAGRRIVELQERLLAAQRTLEEQATHDVLTGLWNRRAILELLAREVARSERERRPLATVMVDLDHFKEVNDRHGHLVGDQVLYEAARRMSAAVRKYETIGRYGGEEFLVVLADCGPAEGAAFAERLRQAVGSTPIETATGSIRVRVSLGVAGHDGSVHATEAALLHATDAALYEAKAAGRDRVVVSREHFRGG